jgi:hypothetical protein
MSPLEQLILKKVQSGQTMSPMEQKAKMSNIEALKNEMHEMMKGHFQGDDGDMGAKVEVASDSPEGLKMGLDKAKDVMDQASPDEDMDSDEDESPMEMSDDSEDMQPEQGELSPEEIDQLQMLLSKLKASKA